MTDDTKPEAQIEALSGVQALSAAPADIAKLRHLYQNMVNGAVRDTASAKRIAEGLLAPAIEALERATPPAEQQAQPGAVYAELPDEHWLSTNIISVWNEDSMRDFADRTHALRQAAPKAAPGAFLKSVIALCGHRGYSPANIEAWDKDDKWIADLWRQAESMLAASPTPQTEQQATTKAAPGVGNSGFDHQTAADFLSGKPVSDEAVRTFVAASRWAHDERAALSATLLAMHGVLTSREAEIALLKKALLEAEAAPQQEAQEPCPTCVALARTVMLDQVSFDRKPDCYGIRQITDDEGVEEWEDIRTSPDVAREEANDMMATGRGEIYEVVPLWTTPQPAPDCHHRPPCDECAEFAAQGGK